MVDSYAYTFGEDFQRKILALAIRGNLLNTVPGAFQSRFFGSLHGGRMSRSPRQRLAELVEGFAKQYQNERPGNVTMDELVRDVGARVKPSERNDLEQEWRLIRAIEVPDPTNVTDRTRQWAQETAIAGAVIQAAKLIDQQQAKGQPIDKEAITKMVSEAMVVGDSAMSQGRLFLADVVDRTVLWRQDYTRRKVKTGFKALDDALDGGPQFGESFYILAPPKGAKTAAQLNIALNALRNRYGVVFFSYEMGLDSVLMRMDRNLAQCTKQELRSSTDKLMYASRVLKSAGAKDIWVQRFNARKQGCAEAARIVERLRGMGQEVDVVFLDYLNIMSPEHREREKRHELVAISREMSALAHELDVVVWSASLVGRGAVDRERVSKRDVWEAFEVISVLHGAVAVCATPEMREAKMRSLYLTALREDEDEKFAGLYKIDLDRMIFREIDQRQRPVAEGQNV